jgi:hypothetical protein
VYSAIDYTFSSAAFTTSVFNVKQFGAVGNGSVDDTAAIQAAITAAQNAYGGVVYFPLGTYYITTTLAITASNISLLGAGYGLATILGPAIDFPLVQFTGSNLSNNALVSMGFQRPLGTVAATYAVNFQSSGSMRFIVEKCIFQYCQNGIAFSASTTEPWILNNYFNAGVVASGSAIESQSGDISNANIQGNIITSSVPNGWANGIYIPSCTGIIANNQVSAAAFSGSSILYGTTSVPQANLWIYSNPGFNPAGVPAGQPSMPSSTVEYQNPYGVPATVYITGGTVSSVHVYGQLGGATGLTSGAFSVPPTASISITYSAAPTWVWVLN